MNAAIAAAKLGAPAAFCGPVSTDAHGDAIWEHLTSNGVDVRLTPRTGAPTARAIIEHVPELRFRFEGDGTALYLHEKLRSFPQLRVTRLARGMPSGSHLEHVSRTIVSDALEGRREMVD